MGLRQGVISQSQYRPMKPVFSIIIPVRAVTPYLRQTLKKIKTQSFKRFEIIVITDKDSQSANPSYKRNIAAKQAKGQILAFLDDDSYPHRHWLKKAYLHFKINPELAGLGGPCLTPSSDSIFQQASGLVWESWLGSGGAGRYRNSICSSRYVDDYPSVNLFIKKNIFEQLGGFQTHHWPGEDTLLCRDITHKLHRKILYHPDVIVFHHRRSIILPHLQQIKRYAIHRGFFFKKYPENSRKLGYLIPSIFIVYLFSIPLTHLLLPLFVYLFFLLITLLTFLYQKRPFLTSLLATFTIPLTHIFYGFMFFYGLITPNLSFIPHQINHQKNEYIGG